MAIPQVLLVTVELVMINELSLSMRIFPATESLSLGVVPPMPTLPVDEIAKSFRTPEGSVVIFKTLRGLSKNIHPLFRPWFVMDKPLRLVAEVEFAMKNELSFSNLIYPPLTESFSEGKKVPRPTLPELLIIKSFLPPLGEVLIVKKLLPL